MRLTRRQGLLSAFAGASGLAATPSLAAPAPRPSDLDDLWGDQGDGTFVNPILPADYSDIDAIRVGDDYYAISSTIHLSPGMVVMHSKDLVNWRTLGHAIPDAGVIGKDMGWAQMSAYGKGIWAGAIRHHAGLFWIFFATPNDGIFVTTARDAGGPWSPLHCVWATEGYNDTCPFWDDDGQGYLVTTHFAHDPATNRKYNVHLFKLSADNLSLNLSSDRIIHQSNGSEANKLYKIGGLYYHYYSEVKPEGRVIMMNRAASLDGPWESRQLNHVDKAIDKEPNQGGLIEVGPKDWWFLTHQGRGDWEGRALVLLPITWRDGWPIIGQPGDDGIGNMVWRHRKPISGHPPLLPHTSDDFDRPVLGAQWEWNHQPRPDKWSLTERPGYLRLKAFKPARADGFPSAGNTTSQRVLRTRANVTVGKLDLRGMSDGQQAGLCLLARDYFLLGIAQDGAKRRLFYQASGQVQPGRDLDVDEIWLRSLWNGKGDCQCAYSLDGTIFSDFGPAFRLTWGHYRGSRIGFYTFADRDDAGFIDIDLFRYASAGQGGKLHI